MLDTGLRGKVVLVTGADAEHGIGAATARAFAALGAAVGITYLGPQPPDALIESVRAGGGRITARRCDLADPAAIGPLFDPIEAALGPLDVLVHNATHWEGDTFRPESGALDWG